MRVLRVEIEAPVCSFRYPHFLVGRQLSFDMPPPSTVFGHVASALGTWPEAGSFRFAYRFEARGKGDDLESQHIVTASGGKFEAAGQRYPKVLSATVQPTRRQMLLGVRMVLYIDRPELDGLFREPRFPVVLGRSQDLASYVDVRHVVLEKSNRGYFERTLLPFSFRRSTGRGTTVLMPRYVGPSPMRIPTFERFISLHETIYLLPQGEPERFGALQMLQIEGEPRDVWIDPASPERQGLHRALAFIGFTSES